MNFTAAAKEIVHWIGNNPTDTVIMTFIGTAGVILASMKYREYKAERRIVDDILKSAPKPGHIEISPDRTLNFYDQDGKLKHSVPSTAPK